MSSYRSSHPGRSPEIVVASSFSVLGTRRGGGGDRLPSVDTFDLHTSELSVESLSNINSSSSSTSSASMSSGGGDGGQGRRGAWSGSAGRRGRGRLWNRSGGREEAASAITPPIVTMLMDMGFIRPQVDVALER